MPRASALARICACMPPARNTYGTGTADAQAQQRGDRWQPQQADTQNMPGRRECRAHVRVRGRAVPSWMATACCAALALWTASVLLPAPVLGRALTAASNVNGLNAAWVALDSDVWQPGAGEPGPGSGTIDTESSIDAAAAADPGTGGGVVDPTAHAAHREIAHKRGGVDTATGEGEGNAAADAPAAAAPANGPRTVMKCLGTTTLTRACHFLNVYYDLSSGRFVYFGHEGASPAMFGRTERDDQPWLRLIRGKHNWQTEKEKGNQFFLDWRGGEPLPPAEQVAVFEQPLHLRGTTNTRSFGHLLRDNLQALVDLPLRFGRDPVAFDWVRWHSEVVRSQWKTETSAAEHYRGLLNNRPSLTWAQVIKQAVANYPSSGVKYVRFAEVIAGHGLVDPMVHMGRMAEVADTSMMARWAHMCDPFAFAAMREVAYRNHGMQVASVHDLEPFVLFLEGQAREKRHLPGTDALLPKLKKTFPGVRMEHVEISKYTLAKQLELLAQATVMVSNIGSRSFRLIYLPNGATTILVGPPEYEFTVKAPDGKVAYETVPMPFQEIESCWAFLGYVNMLQYHTESEAEVRRTMDPWGWWRDARDTNVHLDEAKMTLLLRVALEGGGGGSPAYGGVGTLAAYER